MVSSMRLSDKDEVSLDKPQRLCDRSELLEYLARIYLSVIKYICMTLDHGIYIQLNTKHSLLVSMVSEPL